METRSRRLTAESEDNKQVKASPPHPTLTPPPPQQGGSALEGGVEAPPTVDGFGAGGLNSLPPELVTTQRAGETRVGGFILLIEGSWGGRERGGGVNM